MEERNLAVYRGHPRPRNRKPNPFWLFYSLPDEPTNNTRDSKVLAGRQERERSEFRGCGKTPLRAGFGKGTTSVVTNDSLKICPRFSA
jgi:hypothetical protein